MQKELETGAAGEAVHSQPHISRPTKLAYGFGSVAFGIKDQGIGFFILIFYAQVCGLDPMLVGIATSISIVIDAISDPLVGYYSDTLKSKWGRRHPFMYFSALPAGLCFYLLWTPPQDMSQPMLFAYLLVLVVLIRLLLTFYETPSVALAPEMTTSYDERSSLLSVRTFFGFIGGGGMAVMSFLLIFPAFATEETNGQFSPEAYQVYGLVAALLMITSILVSSMGTHRQIPYLRSGAGPERRSLKDLIIGIRDLFKDDSFRALIISAMFGAVAMGVTGSLALYWFSFMWELSEQQTGMIMAGAVIGALSGAIAAQVLTKTIGKRNGAILMGCLAVFGSVGAITLRLAGLLPENGTTALFAVVFVANVVDVAVMVSFQILTTSMMADVAEQIELKTDRRSEGLMFSSMTLMKKAVASLGVLTASAVLVLAGIPEGADRVEPERMHNLAMYFLPTVLLLWGTMVFLVSRYKITREGHMQTLEELKLKQS